MESSENGFKRQLSDAEQHVIKSLQNYCTTGLRGQLDAAEQSVLESLKQYCQSEIDRVIPPLHQRIEELEQEVLNERALRRRAESEAQRLSETHSEIIELLRESVPSVYEQFLSRMK